MCLAVPLQVIEVAPGTSRATVLLGGAPYEVGLALVDDVHVGDHVLVHAGMAIQKLSPEEARESLDVFAEYFKVIEGQIGPADNDQA